MDFFFFFFFLQLKIQFDDSLTSTFEYPSESSLLEDVSVDETTNDQNRSLYGDGILSNTKLLTSMPLGKRGKFLVDLGFMLHAMRVELLGSYFSEYFCKYYVNRMHEKDND
jgi:hypothetical protein